VDQRFVRACVVMVRVCVKGGAAGGRQASAPLRLVGALSMLYRFCHNMNNIACMHGRSRFE
jgi:hypothetical protein